MSKWFWTVLFLINISAGILNILLGGWFLLPINIAAAALCAFQVRKLYLGRQS